MKGLLLSVVGLVCTAEAGLLKDLFKGKDKCRCEGQWEVDMDSWQEPRGKGGLKPMGRPITMEVWPADDKANALRATLTVANVIGIVVQPKGESFCDEEIELLGGAFSTRMFALGAAGNNEKKIGDMLLDGLERWHCDPVEKTLTLSSPLAQVTFRKASPLPIEIVE